MEWPKVKNIIILILLMVDGCLLVLVLGRQRAVNQYARSAVVGAVQVLEQNGITVAPAALEHSAALPALTASRELQAEQALAQVLLGPDAVRRDRSGGLYAYESAQGTALFRANGNFEAEFEDAPQVGRAPAEHAADLLEDMGLEGEVISAPEGADGETVMLQTLDGAPVYSCRLVFRYEGGRLLALSGTLISGPALPAAEGTSLDLPNALLRFLGGILERGGVCSAVTALRPGYRLGQSFGSEQRLAPTWLVETNAGSYYMDGVTGELESVG